MHVHVIIPVLLNLSPLLAITTTVNQAILPITGKVKCFQMTSYGMESSVVMKAHAALVPTLHHGSGWISAAQQVMISKYALWDQKALLMKTLQLNFLKFLFNKQKLYTNNFVSVTIIKSQLWIIASLVAIYFSEIIPSIWVEKDEEALIGYNTLLVLRWPWRSRVTD